MAMFPNFILENDCTQFDKVSQKNFPKFSEIYKTHGTLKMLQLETDGILAINKYGGQVQQLR